MLPVTEQAWRLALDNLVATADREDRADGYCLDECKKLRRDITAFIEGAWKPTQERMEEYLTETLFCAVRFARESNCHETLALLDKLPDLIKAMQQN